MKNIENYGFDRYDLVIATTVNTYLKNLTPEARKERLSEIVRQDGAETMIDGPALGTLIDNAKVMVMIVSEEWKDGGYLLVKKMLNFIRETLPSVNGKEYVKNPPEQFLQFIEDLAAE